MSKPELKPCPFCGEKRIFLNEPSEHHRYGCINCPACLVVMPGETSDQNGTITAWNTRAVNTRDELVKALEFYANPWERAERVPDFYSELSFDETARAALTKARGE